MQIRFNIDTKPYTEKPPRSHAGGISNRTRQKSGQIIAPPAELIKRIKQGYTFTPAAIGGKIDEWKPYTDVIDEKTGQTKRERKALKNPQTGFDFCTSDFWESQQIIIADIDNEIGEKPKKRPIQYELTPAAALQACKAAGIDPFCIYKTFSYSEKHEKYRVLIVLEDPITDFEQAKDYIDRFSYIFDAAIAETYKANGKEPETCADPSIEPVKLIYGGRPDCIYYLSTELTPNTKLEALPKRPAKAPENASKEKAQKDLQKTYKANAGYTEAQTDTEEIIEALEAINPALLSDKEWFTVYCALKHEGIDYSIADAWSQRDPARYNETENYKRWQSIGEKSQQATKSTIFKLAYKDGWQPSKWQKNALLSPAEWAEAIQSFDNMPAQAAGQEIQEQDYPAGFFDDNAPIAAPEIPEEIYIRDAEQAIDAAKSIMPATDPAEAEAYKPENMTPPPASNKAPAPAPDKKPLQLLSAADYLSRNTQDASQYDADIEELKKYAGRKMGLHRDIDRYLTLFPGLAVLGGQASLGKTTFAINMISQLLENKEHVLFFTLEQKTEEIITKTVSHYIFAKNPDTRLTNLDLGRGSRAAEIEEALAELPEKLQNFCVIECDFETTAADIESIVNLYIKDNAGIKPIVIVDYLQLIAAPEDLRGGDKERIDYNLKAMKRLQKNNGLFMLLISSFNRSSNTDPISYESFFGTSMIEFTCDFVFGLQLQIQDGENMEFYKRSKAVETSSFERKQMIHKAQQEMPKKVQFVSIKNRRGKQFFTANFNYFPANDYFEADYTTSYTAPHPYNNFFDKIKEQGKGGGQQQTLQEAMQAAKEQQG